MIGRRETLDVDAAVLDPADHFESPMNVVRDPRLTKGEKQRVLESWIREMTPEYWPRSRTCARDPA